MSNWYVSSVAYTNVTGWSSLSSPVSSGTICRRSDSPAVNNERCFRCTTSGTLGSVEPTWNITNNATTSEAGHGGTAVWTECTGQEGHQHDNGVSNTWTAPAARWNNLSNLGKNVLAAGDTVFLSSDHAETQTTALTVAGVSTNLNPVKGISVDRTTANLPPLSADIATGAHITTSVATSTFAMANNPCYYEGVTFEASGANTNLTGGSGTSGPYYFKNCKFILSANSGTGAILPSTFAGATTVWDNCTVKFGGTSQSIGFNNFGWFRWENTTSGAVDGAGTIPTKLCLDKSSGSGKGRIDWKGLDLSQVNTTLFDNILFLEGTVRDCLLNGSVTLATTSNGGWGNVSKDAPGACTLEFLNCSSSNDAYMNSWYKAPGVISTETTITLSTADGGATDGTQKASRKMVSGTSSVCGFLLPLEHHIYRYNSSTGSPLTATVEIISSATLNNDDIWGELRYLGDGSDNMSLSGNDTLADILASNAAQSSSTVTWDSSPGTPQKQKLEVTFTPQKAGLINFIVKLAKVSTTVYVNHTIALT